VAGEILLASASLAPADDGRSVLPRDTVAWVRVPR
jgi:hypothetical protein